MKPTRRNWMAMQAAAALGPVVNVRDHGAAGDGNRLESEAIQRALDAAVRQGGGTVYVPPGQYRCGTLRLGSHLTLWIDAGAVLRMSERNEDFDPPETLPYQPHADRATSRFRHALLWGEGLEHVTIRGEGRIDGGPKRSGGPKPISLKRCRDVAIHGVTLENASSYNISMLGCDRVVIDGVTIRNGYSDGIDPDCCRSVRIANCFVESVDDAIVLKASPSLGEVAHTEHVTVTNCVLRTASIHLKCGTESLGDFRNITFSNCTLIGGMGGRHGNPGVALYTVDGGTLRGVAVSNITMQNVGIPLALRLGARGRGQSKPVAGRLEDIAFSNIVAVGAKRPSAFCGIPGAVIRNVTAAGIRIQAARAAEGPAALEDVPEKAAEYPDPTMFGELPAFGLYLRHAAGVTLRDVHLEGAAGDMRPALVADDVDDLTLLAPRAAALRLHNVRHAAVLDFSGRARLRVTGRDTREVVLRPAGAQRPREYLDRGPEVDAGAVACLP
jgi:hypothetical protein